MADKPFDTKTFAQFLEEQQAPAETVTLAGAVGRSPRKGAFVLSTGGQTMELPVDAVKSYKVVGEGAQRLVEIEILTSKIDPNWVAKSVAADVGAKHPLSDHFTRKEITTDPLVDKAPYKDPVLDPITLPENIFTDPGSIVTNPALGAQPFVLATPHHAPASTIAAQTGVPAAAQIATTVIADIGTIHALDRQHTFKELIKDPIFDPITLPETVIPDPTNTAAEGVGVNLGGGAVVNPALQAQALQAQAAQAQAMQAQAMQAQAAQAVSGAQLATTPLSDVATALYFDRPHTLAYFDQPHTIKELIKDPITDPITWVETIPGGGGGTLQEGVGGGGLTTNPVWNLPGMMF